MKTVKKILTLLLIISLSILVMPNNKVLAEEDEPVASPELSLIKNGDQRGERISADPEILKYRYEEGELKHVVGPGTNVPEIGEDGSIDGIESITYEDGSPFGTFIIKIKDNGVVNLTSSFGCLSLGTVAYGGILSSSDSNIKIIGKGKLNITMSSYEKLNGLRAQANVVYNFIDSNGDIIIGDENSKIELNIKLDVRENEEISFDTRIIEANTITLENVNFDIKTRTDVFEITSKESPLPDALQERNRMLIKNSKIKIENQNLNADDIGKSRHFNVVSFRDCAGDFTVENSSLDIKCNDTSEHRQLIDEKSIIINLPYYDSRINLINSKVNAYSNCKAAFCNAEVLNIDEHSEVNITQDVPNGMVDDLIEKGLSLIYINTLNIKDSNFDFSSKGPLFGPVDLSMSESRVTPTFQSVVGKTAPSVNIEENDSNCVGKMSTGDKYLFVIDQDLETFQVESLRKDKEIPLMFAKMNIKSKGSYLRTSFQGSELKKSEYLTEDGEYYTFNYEVDGTEQSEVIDLVVEKLKWNRFEISKDPDPIVVVDTPKHVVLNTGVN